MYRIGVDLGGSHIAAGVLDEADNLLCTATTPTRIEGGAEGVADDIALCIRNALALSGLTLGACSGVGVGSPGLCDDARGLVRFAHNLGWEEAPLAALLAARTGLPVRLGNDANCAALGELTAGAAKGCASALVITLGTGVGTGYAEHGHILAGHRGLGGEFGHMCIALDGEPCTCGARGCWEAYASATALVRQAKAAAAAAPESALNAAAPLDGKAVYAAAAAGDAAACAVTARYAEYVAIGLTNLINGLAPEIVLFGGGVSGAGETLFAPVRDYVRAHAFVREAALLPRITAAALGAEAGLIGAAALLR